MRSWAVQGAVFLQVGLGNLLRHHGLTKQDFQSLGLPPLLVLSPQNGRAGHSGGPEPVL